MTEITMNVVLTKLELFMKEIKWGVGELYVLTAANLYVR